MKIKKLTSTLLLIVFAIVFLSGTWTCLGQNDIEYFNVLTLQKIKLKPHQVDSTKTEFIRLTRIRIIKTDSSIIIGRISRTTDSSVILNNGKEILIKDIWVIGRYFGPETALIGAGSLITGLGLVYFYKGYNNNHHPDEYSYTFDYKGALAVGVILTVDGFITTIIGIVGLAATRHFEIGDKWRLVVKNSHKAALNN
jgi:hypothetical protein